MTSIFYRLICKSHFWMPNLVCLYIYTYLCIFVCVHVCTCVFVCVCIKGVIKESKTMQHSFVFYKNTEYLGLLWWSSGWVHVTTGDSGAWVWSWSGKKILHVIRSGKKNPKIPHTLNAHRTMIWLPQHLCKVWKIVLDCKQYLGMN